MWRWWHHFCLWRQVRYAYRKALPYDVIAERCRCEVMARKPARIAVMLAKATRQSWASQKRHFISPTTNWQLYKMSTSASWTKNWTQQLLSWNLSSVELRLKSVLSDRTQLNSTELQYVNAFQFSLFRKVHKASAVYFVCSVWYF